MFIGKLRRDGDDLVVEIPEDEAQRLQLAEGQTVSVEIRPLEPHTTLRPELRAWLDENWSRLEPGLRYLADK